MRWISLGVLMVAAALLALLWGDVPDRWITHWNAAGHPDGWTTKTPGAAAAPLLIGLFAWALLEAISIWIARGRSAKGVPPAMMAVQAQVMRAVGLSVSLLIAGAALALPLLRPRSPLPLVVVGLAQMGVIVGVALVWAARRTRRLREAGVTMPDGYRGAFYSNPRDTRLWVPKAAGVGWTINFAHRLAWPVMIALVGVPVAVAVLLAAGRR